MQIELDPNPCIAGWGPCMWGFAHACDRGGGHTGAHHCGQCDARTKDRPSLWESDQNDGSWGRPVKPPEKPECGFCGRLVEPLDAINVGCAGLDRWWHRNACPPDTDPVLNDGPGSPQWEAECEEFGCHDPDHSSRYGAGREDTP